MVNAGIFDGDQVLVRQQSTASNGDIVVALVEDSATVKTFYKEKGYIRLQPENDTMDPIILHGNVQILGKVFGVLRFITEPGISCSLTLCNFLSHKNSAGKSPETICRLLLFFQIQTPQRPESFRLSDPFQIIKQTIFLVKI